MEAFAYEVKDREQILALQSTVEAVTRTVNMPTCIWAPDELGQALKIVASVGLPSGYVSAATLPLDESSLTGEAFNQGRITIARDVVSDPRWKYKDDAKEMGWKSVLCVPIKSQELVIGVISIYAFMVREFSDLERQLLTDYADQIVRTINASKNTKTLESLIGIGQDFKHLIAEDPYAVLGKIVEAACKITGADCAVIYPYDADREEFDDTERVAHYGLQNELTLENKPRKEGLGAHVIQEGELIYSDIEHEDPEVLRSPFIDSEAIRAFMGLSLKIADRVLGVLYVDFRKPHQFNDDEKNNIRLFANQAALAIDNARLYQQAQSRADALARLNQVSPTLVSLTGVAGELDKVLRQIVQNALEVLNADLIDLYPYTQSRDEFILPPIQAGERHIPTAVKTKIYPDDIVNTVVKHRETQYIVDSQADPDMVQLKEGTELDVSLARYVIREEIKSTATIPLMAANEVVGALFVNYRVPQSFSQHQRELIELFAGQAAIAIRNTRLLEQRQTLQEIARDITSILAKDELLQKILEHSLELLGSQAGSICLLDERGEKLEFQYAIGKERLLSVPFGAGLIGTAAELRAPVRVGDVTRDPRYIKHVAETRSELDVPLLIGKELIGVLNIENSRVDAFGEMEEQLAMMLADYAALAINNVRLYQQIEDKAKVLEKLNDVYIYIGQKPLEEILNLIVQQAVDLTSVQYGDLWLLDKKQQALCFATEVNRVSTSSRQEVCVPINEKSINGYVVLTDTLYRCEDVSNDPHYQKVSGDVQSELTVPLRYRGEIIGTLNLESTELAAFTEDHERLLVALAGSAAIAIGNAQMYESQRVTALENAQMYETQRILNEMGLALTQGARLQESEVLDLVREKASELMDTDNMYIALYDEATDIVRFGLAFMDGKAIDVKNHKDWGPRKAGKGKTEEIIRTKEPLFHATKKEAEDWYAQPGHEEYVGSALPSWLGVPMMVGEKVLGVVATYHPEYEYIYDKDDLTVLQAIASQAAIALDNSRMFYDINQRLETLVEFGQILSASIQEGEQRLLEIVYEQASPLMDTDNMYIALYDDATGVVHFGLAFVNGRRADIATEELWQPRKAGQGRTEEIIRTKKSILITTKEEGKNWYNEPGRKDYWEGKSPIEFPSWLGVPMMIGQRVIGVIATYHPKKEYIYNSDDLRVLQGMANLTAVAIDNARLLAQKSLVQRLSDLQAISTKITSQLALDELLDSVVVNTNWIMRADFSTLFLYDAGRGEFISGIRRGSITDKPSLPSNNGVVARMARSQKFEFFEDASEERAKTDFADAKGIRSYIIAPLVIGSRTVGIIFVHYLSPRTFSQEDKSVIRLLVNQAAVAIHNAELYQQARAEVVAAKQLSTLGTATAALQHRISNTLNIINPNVIRLRKRIKPGDETTKSILDLIERNVRYTSETITRIQEPLKAMESQYVNVNATLNEVILKIREQRHDNTTPLVLVETELDERIPLIYAPVGQITEVFHNLVDNAYRAMPRGGSIKITSCLTDAMICVRVQDTGPGIPPEIQARLFGQPVPPKDPEKGSGVGLWLSRLILQTLGGDISIERSDSTGTTMLVKIPIMNGGEEVLQ
ncbi:MAG: GAF domain-containing protein [Anaerolineae bacterium]|nr:GAF domain-containing protein [Anaerolineae bacterium]